MQDIDLITKTDPSLEPHTPVAYRKSPELQKLEQMVPHVIRGEQERSRQIDDLQRRVARLESILITHPLHPGGWSGQIGKRFPIVVRKPSTLSILSMTSIPIFSTQA